MKKVTILVGILSGTIAAHAGYKGFYPVDIHVSADGSSGWAWGSLGDARASSSNIEAIYCWQNAWPGARMAYCNAYSEKGQGVSCWTDDPAMIATLDTLQGDSQFHFEWGKGGEGGGKCSYIMVANGSQFRPKTL